MFKMISISLAVAGSFLAVAPAQAHVSFSFGVDVPVYGPPPVYYEPPPVYYSPPPPAVFYGPPAVIYSPAPRYYAPPVTYRPYPGYYDPRDQWDRGYQRRGYAHDGWHGEHGGRDRRESDDRD